jgi:hypothetical protein
MANSDPLRDSMTTVYVVLGENGEYSDWNVWVSGVSATEKDAQDAALAASERRRLFVAGLNPEYERGEHFEVVPAEVGKWQT